MPGPLANYLDTFIDDVDATLTALSGASHRAECTVEAEQIVSAILAADGRHTNTELSVWLGDVGPRLEPPVLITTRQLRDSDLLADKQHWLDQPSTLFDLLVRADGRDDEGRSHIYYERALKLAHATAALDLVPSPDEIAAIDKFRDILLRAMDDAGVARPGQPAATARAGSDADETAATPTEPADLPPVRDVDDLLAELDALVGLTEVKSEVRKLTSLLRVQRLRADAGLAVIETSRHLVFSGNPGTGKTTVARLLSQIYRALGIVEKGHLIETDRADLVAGYVGQTAGKTRKVLQSALGGTLLIDEAYALARGGESDFGLEAIDTLVKYMEDHRDDLAIVACGYPVEMAALIDANPGLQSRFTKTIEFPDYTTDELIAIFELISGAKEYHLDDGGRSALQVLIDAEPRGRGFGNGRLVRNLFEAAVAQHALLLADTESPTAEQLTTLSAECFPTPNSADSTP